MPNLDDERLEPSPIKLTVLVADDDQPTRMLLRRVAENWGYDVTEAADGEVAWKCILGQNPPQLLILDSIMPKITGNELCKRIREELYPAYNPYIIILTQSSGTDNLISGLEAGANEFLTKPINTPELKSRISVGAKVIAYENELAKQNQQLKDYISTIETATALTISASQSLGNVMKDSNKEEREKIAAHFHQLEKVDSDLNEILSMFNEFQSDNHRKK